MAFTRKELDELKALSLQNFGTTSFWQNKIYKKHPLYSFDQLKQHILSAKAEAEAFLAKTSQLNVDSK